MYEMRSWIGMGFSVVTGSAMATACKTISGCLKGPKTFRLLNIKKITYRPVSSTPVNSLFPHFRALQGFRPEVPVGTDLIFECPDGWRLARDWYAPPAVKITCTETGEFVHPTDWGKCVLRKSSLKSHIYMRILLSGPTAVITTTADPCSSRNCSKYEYKAKRFIS